jgi:hypothetical protein
MDKLIETQGMDGLLDKQFLENRRRVMMFD